MSNDMIVHIDTALGLVQVTLLSIAIVIVLAWIASRHPTLTSEEGEV